MTATASCLLQTLPVTVKQQVWSPSSCSEDGQCGSCGGIAVLLTPTTVQLCCPDGTLTRPLQLLSHFKPFEGRQMAKQHHV